MSGGLGSDLPAVDQPRRDELNRACAQTAPHSTPIRCHGMGGFSTRRFFAFGLAAAGAVPLVSRLRFSSANAIETSARTFPIAPVVPKTFTAFGEARIDNYDWLR